MSWPSSSLRTALRPANNLSQIFLQYRSISVQKLSNVPENAGPYESPPEIEMVEKYELSKVQFQHALMSKDLFNLKISKC